MKDDPSFKLSKLLSYEQRSEQMHKWLQMGTTIYEKEKGTHWKHDNELLRRRGKEWARYETKLAYDQDGWGIN